MTTRPSSVKEQKWIDKDSLSKWKTWELAQESHLTSFKPRTNI